MTAGVRAVAVSFITSDDDSHLHLRRAVNHLRRAMDTRLVPTGRNAWKIEGDNRCLGELRKIKHLFVIVPASGSILDDVKGGYGSQAAAMDAIAERTGGDCKVWGQSESRLDHEE